MRHGYPCRTFRFYNAPRRGSGLQVTSSTAERSPFPSRGRTKRRLNWGETFPAKHTTARSSANAPVHKHRRGEAHRRHGDGCRLFRGSVGWVGGVYPSAPLTARTQAFDGHTASTRAARQRRAQVCGEVTVRGDGQGNQQSPAPVLAPHPPLTRSPFPS